MQTLNPTGFYKAYFPPKRHSSELASLMPASEVIGRTKLRDSQLPAEVTTASGLVFEQPLKWRPESFLFDDGLPAKGGLVHSVSATPADVHRALRDRSRRTPR